MSVHGIPVELLPPWEDTIDKLIVTSIMTMDGKLMLLKTNMLIWSVLVAWEVGCKMLYLSRYIASYYLSFKSVVKSTVKMSSFI